MHLVIAIVSLGLLVAFHELGHMLVARLFRMRVQQYSIGFGPAIASIAGKKTKTQYQIGLIPLGGYVRIAGMNPEDGTPKGDPESYANKPAWQRFLVIAAGPGINFLLALVVFWVVAMTGLTADPLSVAGEVVPNSPAAQAGVRPGDHVVQVGEAPVQQWVEMLAAIQKLPDGPSPLVVKRDSAEVRLQVVLQPGAPRRLGLGRHELYLPKGPGEAFAASLRELGEFVTMNLAGIWAMITFKGGVELQGPLGIVGQAADSVSLGVLHFFHLIGIFSAALGLFNFLPVPALDGGRLFFLAYEMVRRRPVNQKIETTVHAVGFMLLLALIVAVTFGDARRAWHRFRTTPPTVAADAGAAPTP